MTDPSNQDATDPVDPGAQRTPLSRRALIGLVVAMWSAGSLSDEITLRLLYGLQGYGQFRYGGRPERDEGDAAPPG